jgi:hypothetical protein
MNRAVRVNVHPRPSSSNWDFHIPYHGNSYDQKEHVHDGYLKSFTSQILPNTTVVLTSNGEPVSRQIAVQGIIKQQYSVEIEQQESCYQCPDPIFKDPWIVSPKNTYFNDEEIISYYSKNYQLMSLFSYRYNYANHSRDHGFFRAVKRYWYQWGLDMPLPPDVYHQTMYSMFEKLFKSVCIYLQTLPLRMSESDIKQKLMFRLNHNPPGSQVNNYLVPRHADNSIITIWLYQNQLGSFVDHGQEQSITPTELSKLHNTQTEMLVFPGFDYCDQLQTMTPATWHGVINNNDVDRVSLVAFLKY